ncbi:MAG TPA: hypothetical protein VED40_16900 [Azospirillaceae bacterium]|nr:hypothetical protein [Azospirillaceae bacterium]
MTNTGAGTGLSPTGSATAAGGLSDEDVRSVVEAYGLARDLGFDDLQGAGLAAEALRARHADMSQAVASMAAMSVLAGGVPVPLVPVIVAVAEAIDLTLRRSREASDALSDRLAARQRFLAEAEWRIEEKRQWLRQCRQRDRLAAIDIATWSEADARQLGLLVRAAGGAGTVLAWLFAAAARADRAGDVQTAKAVLGILVRVRLLAPG